MLLLPLMLLLMFLLLLLLFLLLLMLLLMLLMWLMLLLLFFFALTRGILHYRSSSSFAELCDICRLQQRLVVFPPLACARRLPLGERLLIYVTVTGYSFLVTSYYLLVAPVAADFFSWPVAVP